MKALPVLATVAALAIPSLSHAQAEEGAVAAVSAATPAGIGTAALLVGGLVATAVGVVAVSGGGGNGLASTGTTGKTGATGTVANPCARSIPCPLAS
ncbi:MAG: hypothetical protein CBCREVIR_2516 [Candidatus Burkholderia crenata]|nr:MAG: hypothetical protein CBCREVIR_2516 [Candidatus Burkholderia crenata]